MSAPLIVSAVDFVAEPRDLFERRLPSYLRGHCPHVFPHPDGGEGWSWASEQPEPVFGWDFGDGDVSPRWTYAELPSAAVDPAAHLAAMDDAGIDVAVLFPLAMLEGIRRLGPEIGRACISVYNDWVAETFEASAPDRLIAPRLLPVLDVPWATARELDRALASNARAVLLPRLPIHAPVHDVVWAELASARLAVCIPTAGPDPTATAVQARDVTQLLDDHPALRVVVASVDPHAAHTPGGVAPHAPSARLFDRDTPDGVELYCANVPRGFVATDGAPPTAADTARAFGLEGERPAPQIPVPPLQVRIPAPSPIAAEAGLGALPAVGFALSNVIDDQPLTAGTLAASARRIEEMGFHGIWVGDVVARRAGMHALDAFTALGIAAAVTDEVELGTCIFQVPLRGRVEVAHRALSMHQLVPGRFAFGVGAGSTQADFDACGLSFANRFRELREALPDITSLWRGEQVGSARLYPTPKAVGGPPILIGSWGGSWVERAAREYDGWIASGTRTWRVLGEAVARFRAAGGHRAVISSVFADFSVENGPLEDDDRVHLACSPDEGIARLRRLAALGFTDVVVFNQGPLEPLAEFTALVNKLR